MIGGFVSTEWLLVDFGWRAVFLFGAIVTAGLIPLVLLLVPETPAFLVVVRPARALERINQSLAVLRQPGIAAMPPVVDQASKPKITDILSKPHLRKVTLLLAFGYMFHTITFYYILKWSPRIVADFGYTQAQAGSVLTWANIGGSDGGALFGFLMMKWDIKWPTIILLLLGSIAVTAFGVARETLDGWRVATFLTGFCTNAAIVGYYSAFARGFPVHARATGTGLVLGIGRIGAAGSPILAGLLFSWLGDDQLLAVSAVMAIGTLIAAMLLLILPFGDTDREPA